MNSSNWFSFYCLRKQSLSLRKIPLIKFNLGPLPQSKRIQAPPNNIITIFTTEMGHDSSGLSGAATVGYEDGIRQSHEVGAVAAAAEAATGFDRDVGRRETHKILQGLKRTLTPASSIGAYPYLNLSLIAVLL
uniref:Uncharacterized protein n=1 Tax=Opuntia streptacantha TaxID=393608 RepID=A0A7C9CHF5_OPUST